MFYCLFGFGPRRYVHVLMGKSSFQSFHAAQKQISDKVFDWEAVLVLTGPFLAERLPAPRDDPPPTAARTPPGAVMRCSAPPSSLSGVRVGQESSVAASLQSQTAKVAARHVSRRAARAKLSSEQVKASEGLADLRRELCHSSIFVESLWSDRFITKPRTTRASKKQEVNTLTQRL